MSDRAENLEDIEKRLKNDILQESVKYVLQNSSGVIFSQYNFIGS